MPDQSKVQARPSGELNAPLPPAARGTRNRQRGPAASAPVPTPAVTINVGRQRVLFHVQVASTPEERANGLVGRPSLASDAGVLFVFPQPGLQALSTKDTVIPVDMIFIGANRRIVGIIERAQPLSLLASRIGVASQFVLQIGGGLAAKNGFHVGQAVELRAIPGV